MPGPRHAVFRICILYTFACTLGLSGCSSAPQEINPDPETKEIVAKKDNDIDSPEEVLFQSAKKSYQNQLYSVAKDQFSALMNNFPTGPFAEYAELKIADCSFFIRDYDVCAPQYEEYAKSHPGTLSAAYALLMAARSFHLSSKGVGHDAHALERARETYGRLLEQYPDSVYAKQAAAFQRSAIEDLTANERAVANFYKKRGQDDAYNARMKIIEEKWQPLAMNVQKTFDARKEMGVVEERAPTEANDEAANDAEKTPEAEENSVQVEESEAQVVEEPAETEEHDSEEAVEVENVGLEASESDVDSEGATDEEDSAINSAIDTDEEETESEARLEENEGSAEEHEEDDETEQAQDSEESEEDELPESPEVVLNRSVPAPTAKKTPLQIAASSPQKIVGSEADPIKLHPPAARISIDRVECAGKSAYFYLDRDWSDKGFLARNSMLSPRDGIVSVTLPLTKGTGKTYNCFARADLIVAENGTVTIATNKPLFVLSSVKPPRLAFSIKNF